MGASAARAVNRATRRLGLGSGTVAGGRVGLAIDPHLLARLAVGHRTALVSGTNGKTTTTRLLVAAVEAGAPGSGPVATNATGSNMPAGHAAALAVARPGSPAVLEVDEGYLPEVVRSITPAVVVLLNLSRDQLDRTSEVRMLAGRWRAGLAAAAGTTVIANADDPLVVWGAGTSGQVRWVAAGMGWRSDAVGCPACEGRIVFADRPAGGWRCSCGFARPVVDVEVEDREGGGVTAVWRDGRRLPVTLGIPGRFNAANAVMAMVAASELGVGAETAVEAMGAVGEVAGRFSVRTVHGVATRLLLAKNPAGWHELLELLCMGRGPVVVGINARIADGRDPSWLWDVPFERLQGRPVVATGERCLDLAVRLHYAEVPHQTVRDPSEAVRVARRRDDRADVPVEFVGNYTAFSDLLEQR